MLTDRGEFTWIPLTPLFASLWQSNNQLVQCSSEEPTTHPSWKGTEAELEEEFHIHIQGH